MGHALYNQPRPAKLSKHHKAQTTLAKKKKKRIFCYGNNTQTSDERAFLGSRVQMNN